MRLTLKDIIEYGGTVFIQIVAAAIYFMFAQVPLLIKDGSYLRVAFTVKRHFSA